MGHGFIYKGGDAYAIYYAGWPPGHSDKKVTFAVALGEWDDNSVSADRACFGLEVFEGRKQILFRVISSHESPWGNTDLLGEMLVREDALEHPLLPEVFVITEQVIRDHQAIRRYLAIPE